MMVALDRNGGPASPEYATATALDSDVCVSQLGDAEARISGKEPRAARAGDGDISADAG